jgi:hypothetical protein
MKIIDLLNKIANGEEVPKKIKYDNQIYELTENKIDWYCYDYARNFLGNEMTLQELNNKVEIIEEEKEIPEKITMRAGIVGDINNKIENLDINQMAIEDKLNEIIDYLDYLKSKGDE